MPDLEAVPGAHIAPVRGEVSGHLDPLAATGTFRMVLMELCVSNMGRSAPRASGLERFTA